MIIGFDVGGTNARALLIDTSTNDVVERAQASSAGSGPVVLETLVDLVETLTTGGRTRIDAIGLGVAGLASRAGVIRYSPNLPEIVEYALGTELADRLAVPVVVANDATTGAWAEARLGAGRGVDDFVFVTLGTGIGTGMVADGRLITGANGFAGEAGHMVIEVGGPTHITGRRGPWEYYASGTALGRQGREAARAGDFDAAIGLAGSVDAITGVHVAEALRGGDDDARRVFDGFCRWVAVGCANLVMILDPARIVIGGGLSGIGRPLAEGVAAWLPEVTLGAAHRSPVEVRIAELGDDAGALGAGLLAVEET